MPSLTSPAREARVPIRTDGHLNFLETLARLLLDRRRALALVACVGFALLGMAGTALAATPVTETFSAPGGPYPFTVPAGVTSIRVQAIGGRGGDDGNNPGGDGADVTADLSVTPGQTLYVYVAGNGSYTRVGGGNNGGTNGGGQSTGSFSGGGGGASDLRTTSGDLSSRVLVAAGGGGVTNTLDGGDAGQPGSSFGCPRAQPGTQTAGGSGGGGSCGEKAGTAGTFGQGGDGGAAVAAYGGGGGGGWYGGGGGGSDGTGAGGSSYVSSSASNASIGLDETGSPSVTISYTRPDPSVTTGAATNVTKNSATLNGTVDPEGFQTTYHFEYGTSTSYGSQTPSGAAGSGTSDEAESADLSGLTPDTTYHYRIVASNASGTTRGEDQTFTTGLPECADGADNDSDGQTDFSEDQGCSSAEDDSEAPRAAQCSDGLDNDSDGQQNFPADQGCSSPTDNTESPDPPQCSDRLDNDSDGKKNLNDPGCSSASDNDESNDPTPPPPGRECTIKGTSGNDIIRGTAGADVICAGGGNDMVYGGSGDDVIYGGRGNDTLRGESGNDRLSGGEGNDQVIAGDGNDRLFGGPGRDVLSGQDGRDYLNTRDNVRGNDAANGGAGADSCEIDRGDPRSSC